MRHVIYLSGPYSAKTQEGINANIANARQAAIVVWEQGFTALCPHLNTANFEHDCNITYDDYIEGDLKLVEASDAILMLPGWENSKGAKIEKQHAVKNNIPVFHHKNGLSWDVVRDILDGRVARIEDIVVKDAGIKFDSEKTRWDLIYWKSVEQLAKILTFGAKKYADNNWKKVEPFQSRYFSALHRHLHDWNSGEKIDPDSGMSHLAHAMCNIMFLMWKDEQDENSKQ